MELRVDGTLEKGQFRVQGVWDETGSGHTAVNPRPGSPSSSVQPGPGLTAQPISPSVPAPRPVVNFSDTVREFADGSRGDDEEGDLGEHTVVRRRIKELYSIEVWKDGVREAVVPVNKAEITIGRGSRSITVDLALKGDPEVSRVHAVLTRENDGRYWVTSKGRNPLTVNGREIPKEERTEVLPDQRSRSVTLSSASSPR